MADRFPDELTQLALAAGDGDRIALGAFVRRTQPEVWRLCRRLGDTDDADDLTQEVYARAIRALPGFRGDSSARTWLLTIARHVAADATRSRVRQRRRRARELEARATDVPDSAGSHALARLIADLDADRRDAFVLTQVIGLSYAEAAEVCGCPVGTIRSRVARARDELIGHVRDAAVQ